MIPLNGPLKIGRLPVSAFLFLLSALISFRGFWGQLYFQWTTFADYSHGLLILPLAAYLAWLKRDALKRAELGTDWKALPYFLMKI